MDFFFFGLFEMVACEIMFALWRRALKKQNKIKLNNVFVMSVNLMTFGNEVLCINEDKCSGLTCCLHTE